MARRTDASKANILRGIADKLDAAAKVAKRRVKGQGPPKGVREKAQVALSAVRPHRDRIRELYNTYREPDDSLLSLEPPLEGLLHTACRGPVDELGDKWRVFTIGWEGDVPQIPAMLRWWAKELKREAKKAPRRRGKSRNPKVRECTARQLEVMELYGEFKGNFTKIAKAMGLDRKTVREHYKAAAVKLGARQVKYATTKLPKGKRGQCAVADPDQGPATRRKNRTALRDRRKD